MDTLITQDDEPKLLTRRERRKFCWDKYSFEDATGVRVVMCDLCAGHMTRRLMTVDHIIPRSRGGTNHGENLRPSCEPCNFKRGNKYDPLEATIPSFCCKKLSVNRRYRIRKKLKKQGVLFPDEIV